ncbi:MAG: ComF family protein [Eubacterium sp.]|nr:ComF family protein [Eubacterium sp.]
MSEKTEKFIGGAKRFLRRAADVVYPARCPVCNRIIKLGEYICAKCDSEFEYKNSKSRIGEYPLYYVCEYDDKAKRIVLAAKNDWDGDKLDFMAKSIYDILREYNVIDDFDGVVPIPMYYKNKRERGYNQTEMIARKLSELSSIKIVQAIRKDEQTAQQKQLSRTERQENLRTAFSVDNDIALYGKRLLVLDDVCTTGATLKAAGSLLISAGCESVSFVCFARAVFKPSENLIPEPNTCDEH